MDNNTEFVRYDGFRKAVNFSLEATLNKFTLDKLQECYPMIDAEVLEFVRRQIVELWKEKAETECEKIYRDRQIKEKLNELDMIVVDARDRQVKNDKNVIHLDKVKPEQIVESRLIELKERSIKNMDGKLYELKKEYGSLMDELKGLTSATSQEAEKVERVIRELEGLHGEVIGDEQFEDLLKLNKE
ncbi:hypothetical protein FOA43_001842 [Brettanomyces nanus]|uniref:Uncharacterized protein n=1 Tax=Eeniella nana TaxID=13502 RepID=A0A875S376_EENNA|nr:uncharacterized protein FOA43_001842 [Brettanomyces nanus]QPG74512.1 hypothetical protein FOA43_001842 [Brettanomyces nanus]